MATCTPDPTFYPSARMAMQAPAEKLAYMAILNVEGDQPLVEVSRDRRRVYFTNGLYRAWDAQFYPEGIKEWMVKCDADPNGGSTLDPEFFLPAEEGFRTHQIRLQGGDSSSDTFCYP